MDAADGVVVLDTDHAGMERTVASFLLPADEDRFVLVETGPLSTLATLEREIEAAGFELGALAGVLVTHIHLDHAGAAGALARRSGAPVWVHARGAEHLRDPERLVASARRVYGAEFEALLGGAEPVPAAQLRAVDDGDRVEVAGHAFGVLYTPGHASSHVAYRWRNRLFTGDAAAIRLPGATVVRPATAPPEIDLEAWDDTLERMKRARPEGLLLTHYGPVADPRAHLDEVRAATHAWADAVRDGLVAGEDDEELAARLQRLSDAALEADGADARTRERHRATSNFAMSVAGLKRYWRKRE